MALPSANGGISPKAVDVGVDIFGAVGERSQAEIGSNPMTHAERIAAQLNAQLPNAPAGPLRFWGQWFGKPHDNVHRIVSVEAQGDLLQIHFDEGETLTVSEPRGLEASADTFKIAGATSVRWEWFYYGRPKTKANRYFMEFLNRGDEISSRQTWIGTRPMTAETLMPLPSRCRPKRRGLCAPQATEMDQDLTVRPTLCNRLDLAERRHSLLRRTWQLPINSQQAAATGPSPD